VIVEQAIGKVVELAYGNFSANALARRSGLMLRYANSNDKPMPNCKLVPIDDMEP
jgi:hypothetical protein